VAIGVEGELGGGVTKPLTDVVQPVVARWAEGKDPEHLLFSIA
jgi:hypothetical protein